MNRTPSFKTALNFHLIILRDQHFRQTNLKLNSKIFIRIHLLAIDTI